MSVKLISVKCPECGASLDIEEGRKRVFCTYCGAKILVNDENEYVYRYIDEASIKQAETERIVKLKELEIAEQKREADEKAKAQKIKLSLKLFVIGCVLLVGGWALGSATGNSNSAFYLISFCGYFSLLGIAFMWVPKRKDKDDDLKNKG